LRQNKTDKYERALALARAIVAGLEEKKGEDILLLDLVGVCAFTDFFIIASGSSDRMLKALLEEVERKAKSELGYRAMGVEGDAESGWILVDFGDVVVHLFSPPVRAYYQLEELWNEGRVLVRLQ
jgi:ribosome-associated protein